MKTRRMWMILVACLFAVGAAPAARADSFTFNTLPISGAISGPQGSTIGWGLFDHQR